MYVIPITPETLDLIEVLNSGVRPDEDHIKEEPHFFMWNGSNEHAEIVHHDKVPAVAQAGYWTLFKIYYRK